MLRRKPVSGFDTTTAAPGMRAPEASSTHPWRALEPSCAVSRGESRSKGKLTKKRDRHTTRQECGTPNDVRAMGKGPFLRLQGVHCPRPRMPTSVIRPQGQELRGTPRYMYFRNPDAFHCGNFKKKMARVSRCALTRVTKEKPERYVRASNICWVCVRRSRDRSSRYRLPSL